MCYKQCIIGLVWCFHFGCYTFAILVFRVERVKKVKKWVLSQLKAIEYDCIVYRIY